MGFASWIECPYLKPFRRMVDLSLSLVPKFGRGERGGGTAVLLEMFVIRHPAGRAIPEPRGREP